MRNLPKLLILIFSVCLVNACGAKRETVSAVWDGTVLSQEFNGMNLTTSLGVIKDEAPQPMVINGQLGLVPKRQIKAMFVNWGEDLGQEKGAHLAFSVPGSYEPGPIAVKVIGSDDAIWNFNGVVMYSEDNLTGVNVSAETNFCGPLSSRAGSPCREREFEDHYQQLATFVHWMTTVSSATVTVGETSTVFELQETPSDVLYAVEQVQKEALVIAATPRSARQSTWDGYAEHFNIERQKHIILLGWSHEQNGERTIWRQ